MWEPEPHYPLQKGRLAVASPQNSLQVASAWGGGFVQPHPFLGGDPKSCGSLLCTAQKSKKTTPLAGCWTHVTRKGPRAFWSHTMTGDKGMTLFGAACLPIGRYYAENQCSVWWLWRIMFRAGPVFSMFHKRQQLLLSSPVILAPEPTQLKIKSSTNKINVQFYYAELPLYHWNVLMWPAHLPTEYPVSGKISWIEWIEESNNRIYYR
jgi:hypothetical protein